MHCPVYHLTMSSRHCLNYQAMARGEDTKNRFTQGGTTASSMLAMRYKPCLNCKIGKQVKAGKVGDQDVETLKENHIRVGVEVGNRAVVIDFSNYPEIQDSLIESAKRNFRTVENEILYRLVNHAGIANV